MSKVVLVTGASSGIGRRTAIVLNDAGYKVYAVARRVERMDDLRQSGIAVLSMDVTDEKSMTSVVGQIVAREGSIDILINNAGYGLYGAIEEVPLDDARRQMEVNLFGMAGMVRLVLPAMRKKGWGRIVNVSSI